MVHDPATLAALLSGAGFIAAEEETAELLKCAAGDAQVLDSLIARRLTGEPLAWITGRISFGDLEIRVDPGVYVPRWHSEALARRAVERLPRNGIAVDLCTGSGAIARTLMSKRPAARVVASDIEPRAVACARSNGVEAYLGDLFSQFRARSRARRPRSSASCRTCRHPTCRSCRRDTFAFESPLAYDGGHDGTAILRRVLADAPAIPSAGGAILLELGGGQDRALRADLARLGYSDVSVLHDEEGDVRGIEATLAYSATTDS